MGILRGIALAVVAAILTSGPAAADPAASYTEVASGTADVQGVSGKTRLIGFSCRENAGATAEFILRNGTNASAPAVVFVKLLSGESVRENFGPHGINFTDGVFVDRVSGTTHLTLFTK